MITAQQIVLGVWIIFLIYWYFSAGSVKAIQETQGWLGGNWYPILTMIGFLLIVNFKFLGRFGVPVDRFSVRLFPQTMLADGIAVTLAVAGLITAILARRTLAGNWSGAVALKKDHELITRGPYQYVRHPIYTGILLMALGTAAAFGTWSAPWGFLIILVGILLKLRSEEQLLSRHFTKEYPEYKKRTKTLIPFLW